MKFGPVTRALLAALALLFHIGLAAAFDDTSLLAAEREALGMRSDLERVQSVLDQQGVTDEQLAEQRGLVEKLRLNAVAEAEKLSAPLDDVNQQLNQLGPLPAEGQKEADTIAAQRTSLTDAVTRFTAAKKQFELLGLEAEQKSGKVSALQRTQFFQRIFKPDKSILNPQLWRDTGTGMGLLKTRVGSLLATWWQEKIPNMQWTGMLLLPAAAAVMWSLYRLLNLNFGSLLIVVFDSSELIMSFFFLNVYDCNRMIPINVCDVDPMLSLKKIRVRNSLKGKFVRQDCSAIIAVLQLITFVHTYSHF